VKETEFPTVPPEPGLENICITIPAHLYGSEVEKAFMEWALMNGVDIVRKGQPRNSCVVYQKQD
jgi:hypothetical protein